MLLRCLSFEGSDWTLPADDEKKFFFRPLLLHVALLFFIKLSISLSIGNLQQCLESVMMYKLVHISLRVFHLFLVCLFKFP